MCWHFSIDFALSCRVIQYSARLSSLVTFLLLTITSGLVAGHGGVLWFSLLETGVDLVTVFCRRVYLLLHLVVCLMGPRNIC
jgi:hypothetical protein